MDCGKLLHHTSDTTAASFTDFHACSDRKEALMDCVGNNSTTSLLYHLSPFPSPYCFHHFIIIMPVFSLTILHKSSYVLGH